MSSERTPTGRGHGIGLEVTSSVVRGVRLAPDVPGRVAAVGEAPVVRADDDAAVLDALVRVLGQLGDGPATTRIGWFPPRATLQRLDVTGRPGPELNGLRHELATRHGVTSTMLVEIGARRWMLAVRWDHRAVQRWERLAEQAGFLDVAVEPAPVALGRALPSGTRVARRDAAEQQAWAAVFDSGTPIAAATVPWASRPYPGLAVADTATGLHRFDEMVGDDEIGELVDALAADALAPPIGGTEPLDASVVAPLPELLVADQRYRGDGAHDLRSVPRVAVALGAALGGAGLAGRSRPVDVLSPTGIVDDDRPRPWAIERVADDEVMAALTAPRRRRRWSPRLGRRR